MPEEIFRQLMEHAILAPTAFIIQNWRFVRVTDSQQRQAIRAAAWDQAQVTDASELLVLCFDNRAWDREPGRYWRNAPQEVQDFLQPALAGYYHGKPEIERDEGMRSCGQICCSRIAFRKAGQDEFLPVPKDNMQRSVGQVAC